TNAVKYTEKGEVTLQISFDRAEAGHILLRVTVEDTGIGMKAEDMENLFSPYKRIEEKRNRAIEGTGLGMSITRQLLDLMGSTLKVQSEYGKGSVFSFAIDQEVVKWEEIGDFSVRFNEMAQRTYEYHELFHAPDARILVVDDTEMNLTVIQNLLKRTLITIDTVSSGREAVDLAAENLYDAIFIDHMMPDMDGIETLKHIRGSGKSKDVPAVALTANAVSGAREMYLEAGFSDYLSKPVDGAKLEKMLYDMLPSEKLIKPEDDVRTAGKDGIGRKNTDDRTGNNIENDGDRDHDGRSPDPESEKMLNALKAWLAGSPDIDGQAGIVNCGSEEGYISVLSVFHQTAGTKADEIENYYRNADLANYTIKVHALKSSARIIGAGSIFELARDLEEAGKRKDTAFIRDYTDKLLNMYRTLDSGLSWLDNTDESLPGIDEDALNEAYQTIIEIADSMDYGMMEDILKDLRGYSLPEADRDRINNIERMLMELDWDGIIRTVRERE
ncbi:MAG: response regulator, partial [Lachnospiraceae bacterium]|nr:response regulator [Lachnospiraceae bacterium]